jgi:hypothetical protein
VDDERFDVLSRMLSDDATRRGVLGLLAGVIGLSLGEATMAAKGRRRQSRSRPHGTKRGRVRAQAQPGNSDCAAFCNEVFRPGPRRGRCISDGAHGTGLCHDCQADPNRICGDQPDRRCCNTDAGETCCGGQCLSTLCGPGTEFDPNTCTCAGTCNPPCACNEICRSFPPFFFPVCCTVGHGGGECGAEDTALFTCTESCGPFGQGRNDLVPCSSAQACSGDGGCPPGFVCRESTCCNGALICVPSCGPSCS